MKKLIILLSIFLIGCEDLDIHRYKVPSEVEPFVEDFRNEAYERGIFCPIKDLEVKFVTDLEEGISARVTKIGKHLIVKINKQWWDLKTDQGWYYSKQKTIFHELGHGILEREHVISEKESIMSIYTFKDVSVYHKYETDKKWREKLIDELFEGYNCITN